MSRLEQRIDVACPLAQAAARIASFLRESGGASTQKLTLRLDVDVPGIPTALALQRTVIATIEPHHLPADMVPRYRVEWATEAPGPFPVFAGELVVEGASDYESFTLCLSGNYTPPLGLVGKAFDFAIGNRVAQATAHDLLQHIKTHIETEFNSDEARKPRAAPLADADQTRPAV